jgi:hypothetical protein
MLGTAAEIRSGTSKTTSEINDENQIEKQFMSAQAFHQTPGGRVRETTAGEQFKLRSLESFDPVTQEQYRFFLPQSNHRRDRGKIEPFEEATAGPRLKN